MKYSYVLSQVRVNEVKMLNDPLSNVMSTILNSEKIGKDSCTINPASTLIKKVLDLLNKDMYIGKYE